MRNTSSDGARPFCFFVKIYTAPSRQDGWLRRCLPTLAARVVGPAGGFERFFFIRYRDPRSHLRLRFLGPRSAVLGEPRRRVWEALCRFRRRHDPRARMKTARYRPEIRRYGGARGLELAEQAFHASSRLVLEYAAAAGRGRLSQTEMGLASGELLLEALSRGLRRRDDWFRRVGAPQRSRHARLAERPLGALKPVVERVRRDPAGYVARRLPELRSPLREFRRSMAGVARSLRAQARLIPRPLGHLADSYLHMHWNRLGISRGHEDILRLARAGGWAGSGGRRG